MSFKGSTDDRYKSHLDDVVQRAQVVGEEPSVRDLGGADEEAREKAEHGRQSPSKGLGHLGVRKDLCIATESKQKDALLGGIVTCYVGQFLR